MCVAKSIPKQRSVAGICNGKQSITVPLILVTLSLGEGRLHVINIRGGDASVKVGVLINIHKVHHLAIS